MKYLLQTTEYKQIDIELPFFAHVQEEDKDIFVVIDEKWFKQIIRHQGGRMELYRCNAPNYIADIWFRNRSEDYEYWNEMIESIDILKNHLYEKSGNFKTD